MDRLAVDLGDEIALRSSGYDGPALVVGRVVLPAVGLYEGSDRTSIGDGALVSPEALVPFGESADRWLFVAALAESADIGLLEERLRAALAASGGVLSDETDYSIFVVPAPRPSEIESLGRLRSLPLVLSGVLVLVVGTVVVNAMLVAVRRRRHDLAIMQSMGSTNGGVTTVGVVQGLTIGLVGLLIGVPAGVVAGRWLWIALADAFGTLAEPVVPPLPVTALVLAVLALAAVSGALPVRVGLRHRPAEVLRSE
jgi:predicted lysophospholipase L1 biosynthesis ABC-type transport system permease subunit